MLPVHILVVDDYSVTRRVLKEILRRAGYPCTLAADGFEAVKKIDEQAYDLIILEVAMPDMDGIEVLKHLRTNTLHHKLPVVILTATVEEQMDDITYKAGANAFLTKPMSSHDLIATVEALIN